MPSGKNSMIEAILLSIIGIPFLFVAFLVMGCVLTVILDGIGIYCGSKRLGRRF